jgi:hypothetical protein
MIQVTPHMRVLVAVDPDFGPQVNPAFFDESYSDRWDSAFFGFGLAFSGLTTADERGFIATGNGRVSA